MIDNHKVVINETTYERDTPYGTQHIVVHRVSVHPLDSNSTGTEEAAEFIPAETEDSSELDDSSNQISRDDEVKPHSEKLQV